jgi:hypothetical protein
MLPSSLLVLRSKFLTLDGLHVQRAADLLGQGVNDDAAVPLMSEEQVSSAVMKKAKARRRLLAMAGAGWMLRPRPAEHPQSV